MFSAACKMTITPRMKEWEEGTGRWEYIKNETSKMKFLKGF